MSNPEFEIVIFGATSFVGQILTHHIATSEISEALLRWAIAGRNQEKLEALLAELPANQRPQMILADANDEASLRSMVAQTRVIVSTVGPFARYGSSLVKVCADTGTDYCDITGEVHWVLKMISEHQARAAETGARIVNCCGFDSIPSDLGVYFTQMQALEHFDRPCSEINMRVTKLRGAFSGGTYASLLNAVEELSRSPELRKAVASPYCLCPSDHRFQQQQKHHSGADYDNVSEKWITPFVMEAVNSRIVHRSHALFDCAWGENFRYDEAVVTGTGRKGRKRASRAALGMHGLMIGAAFSPIRTLLSRFVLPKPGEGPSPEAQENGEFEFTFFGKVRGKSRLVCQVRGDRDPGYGSTSKMLAQAALCLARHISKDDVPGGFWTPASIFKDTLYDKLARYAGVTFQLVDVQKK